jgi:hypothetical protein
MPLDRPVPVRVSESLRLATPPIARIVPDGVFDAYGWCASDALEWRRPAAGRFAWDASAAIAATNPARMVFVMHAPCTFLPQERAALHAFGLGLEDELCLAPYAIDDATDELHARGVRPRDVMWLAADSLDGLVWGLHDWAHFHNHGPFVERAWTELQCDAAALGWLWVNRAVIGIDAATWERARSEVCDVARARFAEEGKAFEEAWLASARVRGLVEG